MSGKINIAIDGYSSCGKSTLTKQLAEAIHYKHVDSGAMYRAVTLYFMQKGIDFDADEAVANALTKINIGLKRDKNNRQITYLNGNNVESDIRTLEVSGRVSEVAAISSVRRFLVSKQREIAKQKGVIMDGRDIGTVVLPDAELKIFMTADKEVRVERRFNELINTGFSVGRGEVKKNLEQRDHIDTHRADSPLVRADDAVLLDNSNMTETEQLDYALNLFRERVG